MDKIPSCPSFDIGDGAGGGEEKISSTRTGKECIDACIERRRVDTTVNGVTVYQDGRGGCYCENNMTTVGKSDDYKTCLLEKGNTY